MLKRFAGGNGEGLRDKAFQHPVTVISNSTVTEIAPGGKITLLDQKFRKSVLTVDNVVLAAVEPADSPYQELMLAGIPSGQDRRLPEGAQPARRGS